MSNDGYTQREWERTVGWEKYQTNIVEFPLVIQMERILREATTNRKEDKRTLEDGKEYALNDPIWDKRWT